MPNAELGPSTSGSSFSISHKNQANHRVEYDKTPKNPAKYCAFHKSRYHDASECKQLKSRKNNKRNERDNSKIALIKEPMDLNLDFTLDLKL